MFNFLFMMIATVSNYSKLNVHEKYLYTTLAPIMCMKLEVECGIPTSIQLAQAICESGGGISELAQKTNNHFGIMAFSNWKGDVYYINKNEAFRKYDTVEEGYNDHAMFLYEHYSFALHKPWQYWVANCKGYGGSPYYWQHLGKIIEIYKLYRFDVIN